MLHHKALCWDCVLRNIFQIIMTFTNLQYTICGVKVRCFEIGVNVKLPDVCCETEIGIRLRTNCFNQTVTVKLIMFEERPVLH